MPRLAPAPGPTGVTCPFQPRPQAVLILLRRRNERKFDPRLLRRQHEAHCYVDISGNLFHVPTCAGGRGGVRLAVNRAGAALDNKSRQDRMDMGRGDASLSRERKEVRNDHYSYRRHNPGPEGGPGRNLCPLRRGAAGTATEQRGPLHQAQRHPFHPSHAHRPRCPRSTAGLPVRSRLQPPGGDGELHRRQLYPPGVQDHRVCGPVPALRSRADLSGRGTHGRGGLARRHPRPRLPPPARRDHPAGRQPFDGLRA